MWPLSKALLGTWQQQVRSAWYCSTRHWLDGVALDGKTLRGAHRLVYLEADPSKRRAVYDAWNGYVLDQTPVTAIATQLPRADARPNVRGAVYSIGGNYLDVTAAWLA